MEYDNDRIRHRIDRTELFYRFLLLLLSPLITSVTLFPAQPGFWILLFLLNAAVFPAYLIYARISGPVFFLRQRRMFLLLMTILSLLIIQTFLFTLYWLLAKAPQPLAGKIFFTLSPASLSREFIWAIINMSLALAGFFAGKAMDERDKLDNAQRDNAFFKLRYLRSQLNPHFLFNTLNSIYSLSLQKSEETPGVVIRLADIMRYLIYECNEEKVPLDKEIEFIRNYIAIEKIRYNADIRFTVEGVTEGIQIEPFLFMSFIENGFKHAIDNSFTEPFIYITLKVGEDQLILNVINSTNADLGMQAKRMNGKGLSTSKSLLELLYPDSYELDIIQTEKDERQNSSLRIRNARERLETLYPDAYTLDVILSKSAFTVSLIIKSKAA